MKKVALITGITGQDGSYLAELLLEKDYNIHGLVRIDSTANLERINHLNLDIHKPSKRIQLHYGDLSDGGQLANLIHTIKPNEVYHLGAQSHVRVSFDTPDYTGNITGLGTTRLLEAIRQSDKNIRLYQASSSEMFGNTPPPQNEFSPFAPQSPYACAKQYAYWMVKNYRDGYGLNASNGILFNHESPRRGPTFVTRKITTGIAAILSKKIRYLFLGNLDAKRDWGFAPEYVEAMWKILQQEKAGDYVIGTGETHSVHEYLYEAFSYVDLDVEKHIKIDPWYYRPTEVDILVADARKAKKELGWKPKIFFKDLVKIMIDADLRRNGIEPPGEGDVILEKKIPDRWWKRP